jgi:hypothetical protein
LGKSGFGINRGVGQFALLAMLLMPDAPKGAQRGAIDGHGSPAGRPGLDQVDQMPTETANLGW